MMPEEKVGEKATIETADPPARTDSPEYIDSRKWLIGVAGGGCILCGGESDLSHPGGVAARTGLQDWCGLAPAACGISSDPAARGSRGAARNCLAQYSSTRA